MIILVPIVTLLFKQGLTKAGDDYDVKAAHVELAERMRKVCIITDILECFILSSLCQFIAFLFSLMAGYEYMNDAQGA